MTTTLKALLASGLLLASSVATAETIERDICVFDIAGKVGPTMAAMQDWRTEAMNWGLDANLKVYTNESVVAEDLKAGVCDAALMTGIRARVQQVLGHPGFDRRHSVHGTHEDRAAGAGAPQQRR
jgi:hypothetical protein